MKPAHAKTLVLLLTIALLGCSPAKFEIGFSGIAAEEGRAIPPNSRIALVPNVQNEYSLLEAEVRRKLASGLVEQGYRLVPYDSADVLVMVDFGIGEPRQIASSRAVWIPGSTATVSTPTQGVVGTVSGSGHVGYVPSSHTVFDRWMRTTIVSASGIIREQGDPISLWQGDAKSTGSSDDLRLVLNYLLVPTIENFASNTGRQLTLKMSQSDPRAVRLLAK